MTSLYSKFLSTTGVSTDTRSIKKGSLFFALKGANFNGNHFATKALEEGASYAVIDEKEYKTDERCILVENVLHTLQDLASHHRHQLDIPFIAITGSNGKTTTKELMRDVLRKKYQVHATRGNLNNHIGVPLTLLELTEDHEIAIIEMGANHLEEIALLCSIADPDQGLITNIGKAHIGEFGGFENIIKGKTELYDHLRMVDGMAFVNGESKILMESSADLDRVIYGEHSESSTRTMSLPSLSYLRLEWNDRSIETKLIGDYNRSNVTAAISVGEYFQVEEQDIIEAIANYDPDNNRSQLIVRGSKRIIMDAYNANPSSMQAALDNLSKMEGDKKFAILGHMLELGEESRMEHYKLIESARIKGIEAIFIGAEFSTCKEETDATIYDYLEEAKSDLQSRDLAGHLILVKGSRGIALEKVLDLL